MFVKYGFALLFLVTVTGGNSAFAAETKVNRELSGQFLKTELGKSIAALKQIQAIYGGKEKANLKAEDARKIRLILRNSEKLIYGIDDRKNYYQSTANEKKASRSVALVIHTSDLLANGTPGQYNLPGETVGLCPSEKFYSEPAPGFCSAFRVGKDLIATAGHCIKSQGQCSGTSFVFNFFMNSEGATPQKGIRKEDVYSCKSIVDGELNGPDNSDWRVVRVDREMDVSIPVVGVRKSGKIDIGDPITIVGHPMGLPLKVTPGGTVRSHKASYFVANPDTYGGNSGSPAFNSQKLINGELFVEGILVRGEEDFVEYSPCMVSKICPIDGCRGEDVTYSSEFITAISN